MKNLATKSVHFSVMGPFNVWASEVRYALPQQLSDDKLVLPEEGQSICFEGRFISGDMDQINLTTFRSCVFRKI